MHTRNAQSKEWDREEATGTCAAHHATAGPSIIVIRGASIIVIALTQAAKMRNNDHPYM